jgi:hypothetical protein
MLSNHETNGVIARPAWVRAFVPRAEGDRNSLGANSLHLATPRSDDSDDSDDGSPRAGVPMEWLVLLALHRALMRLCAPERVPPKPSDPAAVLVGGRAERYVASKPVRIFWTIVPWTCAAITLAGTQLYTLAILDTYLEPFALTDEWLLASGWSIVQGWLIEPLIVLMRNNVAVFARNRSSKFYQLMEQLGCGVFIKIAKWLSKLLD